MIVTIITGSVGSGKTTLAKKLGNLLKYKRLHVDPLLEEHNLKDEYDKKRKCHVIDTKKLNKILIEEIEQAKGEEGVIIDSHLAHHLPKKVVDHCIVTVCRIEKLAKRLKKRNYHLQKVKENIECEIFEVCLEEARKKYKNIITVDTTKGLNKTTIAKVASQLT